MSDSYKAIFICTCGEHEFSMRYRGRYESIEHWFEKVLCPAMQEAHACVSPLCTSRAADLKLPMPEGAHGIGMKVTN